MTKKWRFFTYLCNDSNTSEVVPLLTWVATYHISFVGAFTDAVEFCRFFSFLEFRIQLFDLFLFRQAIVHLICYITLSDLWNLQNLFLDSYTAWICFFIYFFRCTSLRLILCRSQGCASLRDSSVFFSCTGSYSCLSMSFTSC